MPVMNYFIKTLLLTADQKILAWGTGVRRGAEDCWLCVGILDRYWYKGQAILLHTDLKRQAFRVVSE
jgi:hypothetical protein